MNNTQILRQLFSAYANSQVTVELIAVYDRRLSTIPSEILQTVIDQCLDECKFLPTIAEIMDRYRSLTVPPMLDVADAWGMVQRKIQTVGSWHKGTPEFEDPLVTKVVEAMGWMNLCMSENNMADRAHFQKMYAELVQRAEREQKLTPESRQLMERKALERKEIERSDGIVGDLKRLGLVEDTFEWPDSLQEDPF